MTDSAQRTPAASPLPQRRAWEVGIVGGGPGGLMTAYFLQKMADVPVRVTIFEAGDRLGGKVETKQFQLARASYEVGAAELYDYSVVDEDPLREQVAELGLSIRPMGGSAVIMGGHVLSSLEDVRERLGAPAAAELAAFDRQGKDWMTPREFYDSDQPELAAPPLEGGRFAGVLERLGSPATRALVENMIHSDLATEPERTSVSYGLQNYLMNDPAYMTLYSIDGGNEQLVQELARRIRATVRLGHRVTGVGRGPGGRMQICTAHEAGAREEEFDFVVVALPNNHVPSVEFRGARLAEAMRRHHAHYDFPAHYLRITILFDRPFWRSRVSDSFFMLDAFGGCCLYDESSREPGAEHGVLGWLLGGQAALEMSELGDEALIAQALDSLPAVLGEGRGFFLEGRVHRWVGAVNGIPGGLTQQPLDRRHQPEPAEHPDFFVVGDYLFDSTLNGVLDSADYVASWLAAHFAENPEIQS